MRRTSKRVFVGINVRGVAGKRTACICSLVGNLLDLLSREEEAFIADATVGSPVVGGVLRAGIADPVDFYEASLAKTAAAEPILIDAADGTNERCTGLIYGVVNLLS